MSDLYGNHIVGFPTRRLKYLNIRLASYFKGPVTHKRKSLDVDLRFIVKRNFCLFDLLLNILFSSIRPDMAIAIDWDVKLHQINKNFFSQVYTDRLSLMCDNALMFRGINYKR